MKCQLKYIKILIKNQAGLSRLKMLFPILQRRTAHRIPEHLAEIGNTAKKANCRLALFDLTPGVQLELIEPNEEPSVWRDSLNEFSTS